MTAEYICEGQSFLSVVCTSEMDRHSITQTPLSGVSWILTYVFQCINTRSNEINQELHVTKTKSSLPGRVENYTQLWGLGSEYDHSTSVPVRQRQHLMMPIGFTKCPGSILRDTSPKIKLPESIHVPHTYFSLLKTHIGEKKNAIITPGHKGNISAEWWA